jgi:hypothetical protein
MSIFNTVVPLNKATRILLSLLEWGSEKYPLYGRLRYVYIEDGKKIVLLLKDGPSSFTSEEDRQKLVDQFTNHHWYDSHKVYEKDPVYFYVYFNIPEKLTPIIKSMLQIALDQNEDIISDPMHLFNLAIQRMDEGVFTEDENDFAKRLENIINKL